MTEPRVEISADSGALADAVAGALIGVLAEAQEAGRVPQVVLTGGTIAEAIHAQVALHASGEAGPTGDARVVDWSRVVFWFGDERFVAADSDERNAGQARRAFLDAVGATQVHEVASSDEVDSAEDAATAYAAALDEHGAAELDVVMLGVGPDGHVASLFPGYPQLSVLDVDAVAVHDSPKPPPDRVSLTFPALNRARAVWFLVSGEGKADAVARALADDGSTEDTPARGVQGHADTTWWLDRDAASRL